METPTAVNGSETIAQPAETPILHATENVADDVSTSMDPPPESEPKTARSDSHAPGAKRRAKKPPIVMSMSFVVGFVMSLAHCCLYSGLNEDIVGSSQKQEQYLRFGTAFAFIAQIALAASTRVAFSQWFWLDMKNTQASPPCLNPFSADSSVFTKLNFTMVIRYTASSAIAVYTLLLILPSFYTPATLSVYLSTNQVETQELVPSLAIADGSLGDKLSFSPPARGDGANFVDDGKSIFSGPRSVLSLIASATSSSGVILPINPPYNHSVYSVQFYAPLVKCDAANSTNEERMIKELEKKMQQPLGTARAKTNVYYAFVPGFDSSDALLAQSRPRFQSPGNSTNELWMTFSRYAIDTDGTMALERKYQRCALRNASYDLQLEWIGGAQKVDGSYRVLEEVPFPHDNGDIVSNMTQHSYSAVFWALADQLVGQLTWFQETDQWKKDLSPEFGVIDSQIRETSLLGSSDLDVFFNLNKNNSWYGKHEGEAPEPHKPPKLSAQRQQDKDMAKNRTLDVLIEELSFNVTVSLLHNELLTRNVTTKVTCWDRVNRYRYNARGLFIPYALANGLTLVVILLTALSYQKHGVMPDKDADHVARLIADRSRKGFVTLGECHTRRYSEV